MAWSDDIIEAFAVAISAAKKYTDEETEQMRTKFVKVNTLPAQGDSQTIYLVPKTEDMFDKKFKDMFGKYCYKTSKDAIISYWGQNPSYTGAFIKRSSDSSRYVVISPNISASAGSVSTTSGNWYLQWSDVPGSDPATIQFGQADDTGRSVVSPPGVSLEYEAYSYDQLIDPYNTYDEYIWTSQNTYEKIGDTEIDLSDYVTDDEFEELLNKFNNQIGVHTVKTDVPQYSASFGDHTYEVVTETDTQEYAALNDGEIALKQKTYSVPNDLSPGVTEPAIIMPTKVKGWDTIASANTLGKVKVGTGLSINPSTGVLSLDQNAIGPEVAEYCSEHFSEWSGALDDTLESNVMAAPADKVGELNSALTNIGNVLGTEDKLSIPTVWEPGFIRASGTNQGQYNYARTKGYVILPYDFVVNTQDASVRVSVFTYTDASGNGASRICEMHYGDNACIVKANTYFRITSGYFDASGSVITTELSDADAIILGNKIKINSIIVKEFNENNADSNIFKDSVYSYNGNMLKNEVYWKFGTVNNAGEDIPSSTQIITGFIDIQNANTMQLAIEQTYASDDDYLVLFADKDKNYVSVTGSSTWYHGTQYAIFDSTLLSGIKYARFLLKGNGRTVELTDASRLICNITNGFIDMTSNVSKHESVLEKAEEYIKGIYTNSRVSSDTGYNNYQINRVSLAQYTTYDKEIIFSAKSGFRFALYLYGVGYYDFSTLGIIPANTPFKIEIARVVENPSEVADIETFVKSVVIRNRMNMVDSLSNRVSVLENSSRFKRYGSHLGMGQYTNVVIPPQSLADVARAKRLGFDTMELNVRYTKDGKYICAHGSDEKFGMAFIGADGSDVSNVLIASMTLAEIKENIRFVTKYNKYKTAPFTLEEMLYECKKFNIIPSVEYKDENEVEILDKIMGKGNYGLGIYHGYRYNITDAPIGSWSHDADVADAIKYMKLSGKTFNYGINHTSSDYDNFTDDDWKNYIAAIHAEGFQVSSSYMTTAQAQKFFELGMDGYASLAEINEIDNGNLCNLFSDLTFEDFISNGTVTDYCLELTDGQTVTPNTTLPNVFLGGSSLHMRFNGTISLVMGKINGTFTSDGISDVWFSSYVEEGSPTFTITSSGNATIYDMMFKASRM